MASERTLCQPNGDVSAESIDRWTFSRAEFRRVRQDAQGHAALPRLLSENLSEDLVFPPTEGAGLS